MADFGSNLRYALMYLRRKYTVSGVLNLASLNALADQVASSAQEEVIITATTFEGGSHQAQLKFDKLALATAIEQLIQEADPTLPREGDQSVATFRAL